MKRDYYEVLGVARESSPQEIKSAYRRLAHEHHPDKAKGNRESEEKFKEIAEAYSVLSDPEKRSRYDRFGHEGMRSGPGPEGFGFGGGFADISDLFGQFFGGGFARPQPPSGGDLVYRLELSFEQAAFGAEAPIEIQRLEPCEECQGSGAAKGTQPVTCSTCRGRGQVRYSQGFFAVSRTCPACHGEGVRVEKPCPGCGGDGRVARERTLTIRVPGGVETGSRLRLSGEGNSAPRGGVPGDLYVGILVADHELFRREEDNVVLEMDLPFPLFVLGGEIEVPTLDGSETVEIRPGTPVGTEIRLRRKGVVRLSGSGRGDQVLRLRVQVPKPPSKEERELLENYARLIHAPVGSKKVSSRIKKIFQG
ncbi:MAG: molecular chaperone DnaJ [Verrucomicrobiota bacterium]